MLQANSRQLIFNQLAAACRKSGCGHFFEEGKGFRFCGSGHFSLSAKADGREKCKEWFLQMPKPPRPAGKPGGYDFSLPTAN